MKKILLTVLVMCFCGGLYAATSTPTPTPSTYIMIFSVAAIDTGKTLNPDLPVAIASNTLSYSCQCSKDRKGCTITAEVASNKKKAVSTALVTSASKISNITSKAKPTPTVTATVTK